MYAIDVGTDGINTYKEEGEVGYETGADEAEHFEGLLMHWFGRDGDELHQRQNFQIAHGNWCGGADRFLRSHLEMARILIDSGVEVYVSRAPADL